ncbi:hypothetical protein [Ruegeria sp. R14_0]|uniref:hypothetical protein n=1 Tax=Ruegeria sp. R14_0 TaxID=2821100 RepID=UPI001AD9DA33|nr:hypothetical protein [Ruegeria sp. R14_0]MBO9446879.1 hypothetical protein [Ruegeria sp. R14_0]
MTLFRIIFIVISTTAIAASGYVAWHGYGAQSRDLDTSVRVGSGGGGYYRSNRIK